MSPDWPLFQNSRSIVPSIESDQMLMVFFWWWLRPWSQVRSTSALVGLKGSIWMCMEWKRGGGCRGLIAADRVQGLLSDRQPLYSAYLKFSLCLITNHSPDSTQAWGEKLDPVSHLQCFYAPRLFFLFLRLSAMWLGAAHWPLKRQTCNLIINNRLNFAKGKQSWEMSASCLWVGWPLAEAGMADEARRLT